MENLKITGQYFVNNVIDVIQESDIMREAQCHKKRLMIHYDIAQWHSSKFVTDYWMHTKLKKVPHSKYSPDLAPCYFGIFGFMKNLLEICEFETEEELIDLIKIFFYSEKVGLLEANFHSLD